MTAQSPAPSPLIMDDDTVTGASPEYDAKTNSHVGDGPFPSYNARTIVGKGMNKFTALINDNIIAARYGVFATIALLTVYGIANTPLFFRYRTVAEIPGSYCIGRRRLYCRIIGVHRDANANYVTKGNENTSIQISVRHLSPIGMLLPTSWFESLMRISPSNTKISRGLVRGGGKIEDSNRDLLRLQIAGVLTPPLLRDSYDPEQFLERLAKNRTLVCCHLLGRRVVVSKERDEDLDQNKQHSSSDIRGDMNPVAFDDSMTDFSTDFNDYQVVLCRLTYRPHWQIFATDIAEALVKVGNVSVASNILNHSSSSYNTGTSYKMLAGTFKTKIIDTSQRIQDIRRDIKYLDRLEMLEFEAAQKSMGMWSVPEVRQIKKEIADEVDYQAKASFFRKIWRMIRE